MNYTSSRIQSIDVFRAITMLLMIFVNDLWTVSGVPKWMEHSKTFEDYMGLADFVFPCFLFIVGMSVPLAIQNRISRGDSNLKIATHILLRSFALLIMGVFTVNLGSLDSKATGINEAVFEILMVIGFFLCWNVYPKKHNREKFLAVAFQTAGAILLLVLAYLYKSKVGSDGLVHGLRIRWWGILGLIGWAYGMTALIYLFARKSLPLILLAWFVFTILNISGHSGLLGMNSDLSPVEHIPGNGAFQSFALAGLLASLLISSRNEGRINSGNKRILILIALAALMFILGLITHYWFIASKNLASPPWIFFSCSVGYLFSALLYWIADINKKSSWFNIIKPAGTNTLSCYLLPYLVYSLFDLLNLHLPSAITSGIPGLVKCFVYAMLIIGITGLLGKVHIRLRI